MSETIYEPIYVIVIVFVILVFSVTMCVGWRVFRKSHRLVVDPALASIDKEAVQGKLDGVVPLTHPSLLVWQAAQHHPFYQCTRSLSKKESQPGTLTQTSEYKSGSRGGSLPDRLLSGPGQHHHSSAPPATGAGLLGSQSTTGISLLVIRPLEDLMDLRFNRVSVIFCTVLFTKNGQNLGKALVGFKYPLYPIVGTSGPCHVSANFGLQEFRSQSTRCRLWPSRRLPPPTSCLWRTHGR
ncbi:hypothetical protein BY458DRAFT_588551 [Sporodiniella umbellata]|nr:hypothetical protein BY458DRAFT_588551 [Sporodiniella umbellata]